MKLIDLISKALVGKKIKIKNQYNRDEWLVVESLKNDSRYVETGPSNQGNDWYPDGYYSNELKITFTNGYTKTIDYGFEFEFEDENLKLRSSDNPFNDRPGMK